MKKIFLTLFILVLIGCGIFAFINKKSTPTSDKPVVKIGVSLPITGLGAYVGTPAATAAKMALEKWREKETKYHYELVIEDDQLSVNGAAKAGNKLIHLDKVNGVVSMWGFATPL